MTSLLFRVCLALCVTSVACTEPDFPAYNELESMRILAVRASPPDLIPGSATELDAVIFENGSDVRLAWSLCPWPSEPNDGFRCIVDQALWEDAWSAAGLGEAPMLNLGEAQSANVQIPDDRVGLRRLCVEMLTRVQVSPTLPPDCDSRWNWTVRLLAKGDEEVVEAVKDVPLLLSDVPERNANPSLQDFRLEQAGASVSVEGAVVPVDSKLDLSVSVSTGQSETYTPPPAFAQSPSEVKPQKEILTFTWFVEGGETDRIRSVFNEGVETLAEATKNQWHTPKSPGASALFVVLRDSRGGVGFVRAKVVTK